MATRDEEQQARPELVKHRDHERNDGSGMTAIVVIALVVGIVTWGVFFNPATEDGSVTQPPGGATAPSTTTPDKTAPATPGQF